MTSEFILRLDFLNGKEREKALSRHARPSPPSPFSSGTTCMILGGGTIFQTLNFVRLDFSIFFLLVFCFSVSDRVSKSKFLFPFSFSSHERLPWFKHV
jgi:hypothetical protein